VLHRRFVTLGPDNDPRWVRVYVRQVGGHWAAMIVPEAAEPPRPGEVKGLGFFAETAAEAKESALRYLGRCLEDN
jgi:hypothetical protein